MRILIFLLSIGILNGCSYEKCRHGHLTREATCELQKSSIRFLSFGWEYHLAKGPVESKLCETTKKSTASAWKQGFGSVNAVFKLVPCKEHIRDFEGYCILGQNGGDIAFLAMNAQCSEGLFFNGHNRKLLNGEIVPLN